MSSPLKEVLEKATHKTQDCAEAKYVAAWAEDVLDETNDDPSRVADSMELIITWAIRMRDAARRS